MSTENKISVLCKQALNISLSNEASLKIQSALHKELRKLEKPSAPQPIMTIEEVSDYLRTNIETLENYLGDIPCFELGGRLLFRKDAVDNWLGEREKKYTYDVINFNYNKELKITGA
ncbi:MAG: helix-turn-helix domain-containing protein [Lentisphaerota bacterium]